MTHRPELQALKTCSKTTPDVYHVNTVTTSYLYNSWFIQEEGLKDKPDRTWQNQSFHSGFHREREREPALASEKEGGRKGERERKGGGDDKWEGMLGSITLSPKSSRKQPFWQSASIIWEHMIRCPVICHFSQPSPALSAAGTKIRPYFMQTMRHTVRPFKIKHCFLINISNLDFKHAQSHGKQQQCE